MNCEPPHRLKQSGSTRIAGLHCPSAMSRSKSSIEFGFHGLQPAIE
jgi:hypothetical protein